MLPAPIFIGEIFERDRLAMHYHQSYQVRRFRRLMPSALLLRSPTATPMVHLFDEPQFNLQDGYIGFMLDFCSQGCAPRAGWWCCACTDASWHLEILAEIAEQFLLVADGGVARHPGFRALVNEPRFRNVISVPT